jgi:phospholipase/carboxylesterase
LEKSSSSERGWQIASFRAVFDNIGAQERWMPVKLDGPSLAPLSGGKPACLVVIFHGVAANGNDVLYLARFWQKLLPKAEFVAPNAPFSCDYAPDRRQWFSLQDRVPEKLLAGLREADRSLDPFLDELLADRALDDARLALAGFSQGAAMALYAGLRRQKPLAGVAAFSGSLPLADGLRDDIRSRPPVLLVHGNADDVVPFQSMASTKALLAAAGVPIKAVARPGLGHEIDEIGAALAGDFFRGAFDAAQVGLDRIV